MRVALIQMTSSDDPEGNIEGLLPAIAAAADGGARLVLTPEVTNCVSASRTRQTEVLRHEGDDPTLRAARDAARDHQVSVLLGSLALKGEGTGAPFVNRSFLIDPSGEVTARYDKIHMFDVAISPTETYRESAGYEPGDQAALGLVDSVPLGLTVCYDLRFPHLFRALAQAGAKAISVPSAFSPETGGAHWKVLLRARAIETGAYVLAPAQTGAHTTSRGRQRQTYGHSLVVDPWGDIILDAGTEPGVFFADLNLTKVDDCRRRLPSLSHDRPFKGPL